MFNTQENLQEIKIIVLGNSGVGKTSIINNYIFNQFNPDIETTFANSLSSKVIKKGKIKYMGYNGTRKISFNYKFIHQRIKCCYLSLFY